MPNSAEAILIDYEHFFDRLSKKSSKKIKNTKKLYLMTTNKKQFYSQFNFKEVTSQNLLIREI